MNGVQCPDDEHDDRRDPFFIFPSNPPQERIVCAKCGRTWLRVTAAQPLGVTSWPKA